MPRTGAARPSAGRCGLTAALGALTTALLVAIPVAMPASPIEPGFLAWWERVGTAQAVFALVRVVAIGSAGWALAAGILGWLAASTRAAFGIGPWRRVTPRWARGVVAVSAVSAAASSPAVGAAEPGDRPPIVLFDLGPAADAPPVQTGPLLQDLGPAPVTDAPDPTRTPPAVQVAGFAVTADVEPEPQPPDTWVVAAGDHLWRVAEETLRDDGLDPTIAEIATYWHRVIEANRETVGADPDLIHPGQVLVLPPR